jgi:hypothetical protein
MSEDQTAPWQITDDTIVYASDGTKVGYVRNYDPRANYLDVQKGWLFPRDFYVPLVAVQAVTGEGVVLRLTLSDLEDDRFDERPPDQ